MTVLLSEGKDLLVLKNQKEWPKREDFSRNGSEYIAGYYKHYALADWIASAERIKVAEGEEERIKEAAYWEWDKNNPHEYKNHGSQVAYANFDAALSSGIPIPEECVEVREQFCDECDGSGFLMDNMRHKLPFDCRDSNCKNGKVKLAYFKDRADDRATNRVVKMAMDLTKHEVRAPKCVRDGTVPPPSPKYKNGAAQKQAMETVVCSECHNYPECGWIGQCHAKKSPSHPLDNTKESDKEQEELWDSLVALIIEAYVTGIPKDQAIEISQSKFSISRKQ